MAGFTFNGGIHPYDGKELSKFRSIKEYLPQGLLIYPLSQHIGAPAKALVSKGDRVVAGQLIAEAGGFVSANIYATVSGTVKSIEQHRTPTGDMADSIVIENDNLYESAESWGELSLKDVTRDILLERVKRAGVVGMGGAGFPTHVKLSPKEPDKIEYIIANCAECEPYLTSDYRLMLEEPHKIIDGMKCVLTAFENARGIIAIEDNKPDCIDLFRKMLVGEKRIEVRALETKYPQGSERQLIYAVTKRAINSSMLPADVGCIVNNADTLAAIYEAVLKGRALLERIVTVTGDGVREPQNFRVRMGTSYAELIEAAGGLRSTAKKVVSGGPMMGFALFDTDVPVVKTSSAILCIDNDAVSKSKTTPCISCGLCVEACPSRLVPARLADFAEHGNMEKFVKCNGMECMECGSCAYVCPAKRPLTQMIKSMRKIELSNRRKPAAAPVKPAAETKKTDDAGKAAADAAKKITESKDSIKGGNQS